MKELEKVQSEKITLKIYGKEREIKFGFSAWAKLEKEFGGLKHLDKLQEQIENEPFSVIPHLLFIGLVDKSPFERDGEMIQITEENILDEYGLNDMQMISEVFQKALYGSLPQNEGKEDDEKKSVETEAMLP